jgi:hypothetical protein
VIKGLARWPVSLFAGEKNQTFVFFFGLNPAVCGTNLLLRFTLKIVNLVDCLLGRNKILNCAKTASGQYPLFFLFVQCYKSRDCFICIILKEK